MRPARLLTWLLVGLSLLAGTALACGTPREPSRAGLGTQGTAAVSPTTTAGTPPLGTSPTAVRTPFATATPVVTPAPPPPWRSVALGEVRSCMAADLDVQLDGGNGAGIWLFRYFRLINRSSTTCSLPWCADPRATAIDEDGNRLPSIVIVDRAGLAASSPCREGEAFTVEPAWSAFVGMRWRARCEYPPCPDRFQMRLVFILPGSGEPVTTPPFEYHYGGPPFPPDRPDQITISYFTPASRR